MPLITPLTNKTSALTTNNAWHTVNCSELPGSATGVVLLVRNLAGAGAFFPKVRRDASAEPTTSVAVRLPGYITLPVPLTASRTFDFYADGSTTNYELYLAYYFESEATWFTTPVIKTQTAGGTWQRISFASEIGGGTALALLGYADAYSGGNIRMVGSTDDRLPGEFNNDSLGVILGLSSNKEIEYRVPYSNSSRITAFGYLTSGFTPFVNATEITPPTVGSYVDVGPFAAGAVAALVEVDLVSPGDSYYLRRKDNTEDFFGPQRAPLSHNFVGLNGSRLAELKYGTPGTKFFAMGIFGTGAAPPPVPSLSSGPASCRNGDANLAFSGNNLGATINDRVVSIRANYGGGVVNVVQPQTSGDANGGVFTFNRGALRPGDATLRVLVGSTPLERPITILPDTGSVFFTAPTVKADASKRLATVTDGDIVAGDMVRLFNVIGNGVVEHTSGYSLRADSGVTSNEYQVHNGLVWGAVGTVTWAGTANPPGAPTNLAGTALDESRVSLSWGAASDNSGSGIRGYRVRRNGVQVVGESTQNGLTFTDTGLSGWTQYSYTVAAVDNNGGVGPFTSPVTVRTTDSTAPSAVSAVSVTTQGGLSVRVSWQAATDSGSGVTGYRFDVNGGPPVTVTGTQYVPTGLAYGVTYVFGITAIDAAGNVGPRATSAPLTLVDDVVVNPVTSDVVEIVLRHPTSTGEGTRTILRYWCYDEINKSSPPASLRYRVDCQSTGTVLRDWTVLTAAPSGRLEITPSDNRIVNQLNTSERRAITMEADFDTDDAVKSEVRYTVRNLVGIK